VYTPPVEAVKLHHAFKVADGKSESHCGNIFSRLKRVGAKLPNGALLDELTAGQLENAVAWNSVARAWSFARVPTYQQGFEMNQFGWYRATESLTIASLLRAASNVAQDAEEIEITF
jgi:hypothetical protein